MRSSFLNGFYLTATLFATIDAQCINEKAASLPMERTIAADIAVLVVEVPREAVEEQIKKAWSLPSRPQLLPLPKSLNVPVGKHLVFVTTGLDRDIRQSVLAIKGEMRQASIIVPYVGIDGSSTPLSAPLITHIAGTGEKALEGLAALIPALVSTLFGILTLIGSFIPRDVPFLEDANGFFSASVDAIVVPNTFSGPGVYPSVFDVKFRQEDQPKYAMRDMKELINLPYILNQPIFYTFPFPLGKAKCQRNTYFTNSNTAQVQNISGTVTFGQAVNKDGILFQSELQKASPNGVYQGAHGFRACAQLVGYKPFLYENCDVAAKAVDPDSLI